MVVSSKDLTSVTQNNDLVTEFDQCEKRLDQAKAQCVRISEIVQRAGLNMKDWRAVVVSNVNVSFPTELTASKHGSINALEWPTAQKIADVLAEYHTAKHAHRNAIARLPKSMQDRFTDLGN